MKAIGGFVYLGDRIATLDEALQYVCKKRHLEIDRSRFRFRYNNSDKDLSWDTQCYQLEQDTLQLVGKWKIVLMDFCFVRNMTFLTDLGNAPRNSEKDKKEVRKSVVPVTIVNSMKHSSTQLTRSQEIQTNIQSVVSQEEVIKKQTQYNNIMQEIITTENNYVNDLRLIDEVLFF